jgi:uncharacterized repeat protein (TIGR01451 family)
VLAAVVTSMAALLLAGATTASAATMADMSVTVTGPPFPLTAGDDADYTIKVRNNGPNAADVTLADAVPANTTFRGVTPPGGFSCTAPPQGGTGSVSCSSASLASGATATFDFVVNVNSDTPDGSMLSDTATVSTTATDSNQGNDSSTATSTVNAVADLATTVSGSPDTVDPGGNVTYTIGLHNNGPSDAQNVTLADDVPTGATFVSFTQTSGPTFTCTAPSPGAGGTVTCAITTLPAGSSASFDLVVNVSAGTRGIVSDTASGSASTTDPDTTNNSATASTPVRSTADLAISNSDSPDPVSAGGDITYTLTVTNNGPDPVPNATITDDVPDGTTFVSTSSPAGGSCAEPDPGGGGTVECSVPPLASGNSVMFTITVAVQQDRSADISDTASVASPSNTDATPGNDSSTATTTVSTSADLSVSNSDSPDPVNAGALVTYAITLQNAGPSAAVGVTLADTIPANATFSSVDSPAGFSCTTPAVGSAGTVSCSPTAPLPSGTYDFKLAVRVDPSTASGTVLSDTATVSSSTTDPNPGDESATTTTTVNTSADVATTLTDSPDPVPQGDELTYSIGLSNNGPSDAQNVTLQDTPPAGTTFVSLTQTAGPALTCTTPIAGGGGTVACSIATLPAGSSASFDLVVNVPDTSTPGTVLSDTATASSSTSDPAGANNSATTTTTVAASTDLSVSDNSDSPDPVAAGQNLTYSITLADGGPSDAQSPSLTDTLPAGTTFVSVSAPNGFSCTAPSVGSSGTVTCTGSTLANGGSATFTIVVRVDPGRAAGSSVSNTATASTSTHDRAAGNDSATATTAVTTSADLSTSVSGTPAPVTAGTNLSYAIAVTDAGPSDAQAVSVTDDVPAGTTFVSATAPSGFTCSGPSPGATGTVTCGGSALAAGATATFTVVVRVDPGRADGSSLSDSATATTSTADPAAGNNAGSASTAVTTSADLSVSIADSPDPVSAGDAVGYRVRVHDQGPSDASAPRLAMAIPDGTTLVSATQASGPHFDCTHDASAITCTGASLPAGADAAFDFVVKTDRAATGSVTARPEAGAATADPDRSNNASTETTAITAAPPTRLAIGSIAERARSGVIFVPLTCRNFVRDFCDTTVTVTFEAPHHPLAALTRPVRLTSGVRTTVFFVAPKEERMKIKAIGHLPVTVTATNPPGPPVSRSGLLVGSPRRRP